VFITTAAAVPVGRVSLILLLHHRVFSVHTFVPFKVGLIPCLEAYMA